MLLLRASDRFKTSISFPASRKVPLLCLLAFIIAVAIAATFWAALKIKNNTFSNPLLVLLVLLSVAEGALGKLSL
jgi:phosphotransferase system  glucose/maltose/N-acetylglucosamine-specific IIC component